MDMHNKASAAVGVVGATGYTGQELLGLLEAHEGVQVVFATARTGAGDPSVVPGLPLTDVEEAPLGDADLVFLCLPHGEAVPWARRALDAGSRVVDLTADHRPGSGREASAVYGMADLLGDCVRDAALVANPGCYPTGVHLALHPLLHAGVLDASRPVVINAASGVTGAGRSPRRDLLFAEVAGDYRAYATGNGHRHLLEMRTGLPGLDLLFQPHLLPVARGILETLYLPVKDGVGAQDVRTLWQEAYASRATIRIRADGVPGLAEVTGTDVLALGAEDNEGLRAPTVTAVAALDNLGKGAAGQAVHNMNLMLGYREARGLRC